MEYLTIPVYKQLLAAGTLCDAAQQGGKPGALHRA